MPARPPEPGAAAVVGRRALLAVDIGATKTLVALCEVGAAIDGRVPSAADPPSAAGSPFAGRPARFPTVRDPIGAVSAIVEAATVLLARSGARLVGAGVVAPGPLDATAGRIDFSPNLGWRDVPLAAMLADAIRVPVLLEDDATAAALGEGLSGAGRGADPFAYLTVSSGVGAGIVVGGRSLRGAHGIAGEVGHLVVDPSGPRCGCGRRGDVESFAGGASLARRARLAWPGGRLRDGSSAPSDASGIFRAARAGDADAARLAGQAAEALGAAIAVLAAVVDPALIAVGGSIGLGQPWLRRRATAIARRRTLAETGRAIRVVPAALGDLSCLAGAAALAIRRFDPS